MKSREPVRPLLSQDLTGRTIGVFFDVYNELGHGFLEAIYERAMAIALRDAGLEVQVQPPFAVWFRREMIGQHRADLIVESRVLVEVKAGRQLVAAHEAQVLHYLRASGIEVGLLLNFGAQPTFRRLVSSADCGGVYQERALTRENTSCAEIARRDD